MAGSTREFSVQSVDRAVSILEMLAASGTAGITEISSALGIHKSTAFRLVTTLEARGLIEQEFDRGKYRVGYTAVQLAAGVDRMRDIATISRPVCQQLAAAVGETVTITVRDGFEVLTVDQATGAAAVAAMDSVGRRQPMHSTAAGKVFLAAMAEDELQVVISHGLAANTDATLTDPIALREHLAGVRARGFAASYEEYEVGLGAMAVPVRTLGGAVVAALAISGPAFRVNEQSLPALLSKLESSAARVSWRAGYPKRE